MFKELRLNCSLPSALYSIMPRNFLPNTICDVNDRLERGFVPCKAQVQSPSCLVLEISVRAHGVAGDALGL